MPRFRVGDRETVTHALALIESIGVEARNEVFLLYAIFYRYNYNYVYSIFDRFFSAQLVSTFREPSAVKSRRMTGRAAYNS